MKDIEKEFKPTTWSINNRTSIFILTIIITLTGIISFNSLPKEKFPDIVIPTIYVSTINAGTSPQDIENLITKPIEKELKAVSGIKNLTSNSIQDFSNIIVEFDTDVPAAEAKQKVKDAVDKARTNLPTSLTKEPNVQEVNFSDIPVMFVNISGDFDLNKLKQFADDIKDECESLKEITRVDIVGALDREIQVNVDRYKMEAADITMADIQRAIGYENMTISGGQITMDNLKRNIAIKGEYKDILKLRDIVIRSQSGAQIYLKDIAEIKDGFKEKESYARLGHNKVITLNIIKRAGENLIETSDKVHEIVDRLKVEKFPKELEITITGDQSTSTRTTLKDLINTIIIGFVLVLMILMFFMGVTNAFFVALSVPLSCFVAFLIFPSIGFALNMIVLFAFLLALGIVVDDAVVVIENTHRIFDNGKVDIKHAAKIAAGEVFLPVLTGTLTTLAPFIPLAFWKGVIGKFMVFLPITLIITLLASLLVAYIINPVFAVQFMKPHEDMNDPKIRAKKQKGLKINLIVLGVAALVSYLAIGIAMGNFVVFLILLTLFNRLVLEKLIIKFQTSVWPSIQNKYENLLRKLVSGKRPVYLLAISFALLVFSFIVTSIVKPKVVFFPQNEPNFIYTYITLPVGTSVEYTDSITRIVENKIYKIIEPDGKPNPIVESIISNVAIGATDPNSGDRSTAPNKGKVSVAFVEFEKREGKTTGKYLDQIREAVKGIPGAEIVVDKEANGPPVGKPVSIEITGDNLDKLVTTSKELKLYLDSLQIPGIEELKSDVQNVKPEIVIDIDRERANREGISTAQIGMEIRNAVFGIEASKYRDENDEYPIQIRFKEDQRDNIDDLLNLKITYRDMNMGGMIRQVPLNAVASVHYSNTFGGIKRKNQKRIIMLESNILSGYTANEVVSSVQSAIKNFNIPDDINIHMGGEQEKQQETAGFLGKALLISLGLMFLILVTQFNSISKPIIILSEILFSITGVFLGISIFNMTLSVVMTGVGIVALGGIIVRNGILLVEFTDLLIEQGMPVELAVVEAGRTRMTPVILTACATILGLIPLAVGFNIDFVSLFESFQPKIFFGGDNVAFWGPLSWTMIFGLSFGTFLTLFLVPAMYLLTYRLKEKFNLIKKNQ
ncbi:MAG: efflux RND transporter permease subunit [Bacteroidia bacterium]|nr:efflux RND transporter permease subunit [Bacteroidia bacterium]MCZ2248377.1 efflux RND transporter permease subunit [Bacteroidia bacterium]